MCVLGGEVEDDAMVSLARNFRSAILARQSGGCQRKGAVRKDILGRAERRAASSLPAPGAQPERLHPGNPYGDGFPTEMLEELVMSGLSKASSEEMPRGRRKLMKVVWMQITEFGQKAILE
jgi:hypothetical protein